MPRPAFYALLTALALMPALAAAQPYTPPANPGTVPQQVVLSKRQIDGFLSSYPPVMALCEKYDTRWSGADIAYGNGGAIPNLRRTLEQRGAMTAFNNIVRAHGFQGYDDWWRVTYSVLAAHGFASNKAPTNQELDAGTAASIAQVQGSAQLSAAQKKAMTGQIRQSMGTYSQTKPPPGNITLVKPYATRIAALIGG